MAAVATNTSEIPFESMRRRPRKGSKASLGSIPEIPHVDSDDEEKLAFAAASGTMELSDERVAVRNTFVHFAATSDLIADARQSRSSTAPAYGNSELQKVLDDASDSEDGSPSICRVDTNNSLVTQFSQIFESTPVKRDQPPELPRSSERRGDSFAIGGNNTSDSALSVPSNGASVRVRNTFIELADDQKPATPVRQPRAVTEPGHVASALASMVDSDDEDEEEEEQQKEEVAKEPVPQIAPSQQPFAVSAAAMQQQMMWMMMYGFAPPILPTQLPMGPNGLPQAQGADAAAFAAQAAAQAQLAVQMAENNLAFTKAQAAALSASKSTTPAVCNDTVQVLAQGPMHGMKNRQRNDRARPQSENITEDATTVVLKNLPLNYKRNLLLKMLDYEGFSGEYDFVYMPVDFDTGAGLGYAFVNLVTPDVIPRFWKKFDGYNKWLFRSAKICAVGWSTPHQGLAAHIRRFKNSPLMHESVPDEYRPILLDAGSRVAFPPPTKELWAPNFINSGKKPKASQQGGA